MDIVKVNQAKVRAVAKDISKDAEKIESLRNQIKSLTANLEGEWIGLSKEGFDMMQENWSRDANKLINELKQISAIIESTANKYKNADEAAAKSTDNVLDFIKKMF